MIIDVAFIIVMIIAIFKGFSKGFIVGIFSLLAFIIGLAAALKFSAVVAVYLEGKGMHASKWLPLLSFFLVFIVVILLVGLGAKLVKKTVQLAMLGWLDGLLGIFLYIIIYIIIFSTVLFFADKMRLINPHTIEDSYTYKYVSPWGPMVINNLGKIIPVFKDLFLQLEDFFDSLSKKPV
ncbi:MAG: CvpA family protein [Ginsengibacter sp.]